MTSIDSGTAEQAGTAQDTALRGAHGAVRESQPAHRDGRPRTARPTPLPAEPPELSRVELIAQEKTDRVVRALALSRLGLSAQWGERLAGRLAAGGRLLIAGNGGSAAQAQHLSAELVGRYLRERRPLSAIALHADTSCFTAICNDYGAEQVFARQVEAHGRPGDTVLLISTSGSSANTLAAAARAKELDLAVWALTGPAPNPLAALADEALSVDAAETATVQEVHMVAVHLMCEALDQAIARLDAQAEADAERAAGRAHGGGDRIAA